MNLHITHDNFFIDYIINTTKTLGLINENRFCVYLMGGISSPKYVKSKEVEYSNLNDFITLIGDVSKYKAVFVHWMHYDIRSSIVNSLPPNIKVVWCFWGGDGLESDELLNWVYQPESFKLYKQTNKFSYSRNNVRFFFRRFLETKKLKKSYKKAVKRVDFFAHYILEDYELVRKTTHSNMKFLPFFYMPYEVSNANQDTTFILKNDIILGNSDTLTNNHIEAIDHLASLDLKDTKIICPLSYEKGTYAKIIEGYGKEKLSDKFIPLLDFLPIDEYNAMLSNVGFAVLNHNRSQALGNIYFFLANGIKIFMSHDSTLFKFLKRKGFIVFAIQDELKLENLFPMSEKEINTNKMLLIELFGNKVHLEQIKNIYNIVNQ